MRRASTRVEFPLGKCDIEYRCLFFPSPFVRWSAEDNGLVSLLGDLPQGFETRPSSKRNVPAPVCLPCHAIEVSEASKRTKGTDCQWGYVLFGVVHIRHCLCGNNDSKNRVGGSFFSPLIFCLYLDMVHRINLDPSWAGWRDMSDGWISHLVSSFLPSVCPTQIRHRRRILLHVITTKVG